MTTAELRAFKIIYTDDDKDDRVIFQEAFKTANTNATLLMLEGGLQLLRHLLKPDEHYPDIIFLDINMPDMNGKACLKEIRSNHKFNNITIIMFTTSFDQKDVDETFVNGATLYVTKPSSFTELIKILQKIFTLNLKGLLKRDKKTYVLSLNPDDIINN